VRPFDVDWGHSGSDVSFTCLNCLAHCSLPLEKFLGSSRVLLGVAVLVKVMQDLTMLDSKSRVSRSRVKEVAVRELGSFVGYMELR